MSKVLVVGSVNADITLKMDAMPQPGQCLLAQSVTKSMGGKGLNQGIAMARQEIYTTFVGKVGRDSNAAAVENELKKHGVHASLLYSDHAPTGEAYILLENNAQNRIIVYGGANQDYTKDDLAKITALIDAHDALLVQLEISLPILQKIIQYAVSRGKFVVVDCGPAQAGILDYFAGVNVVSPNETELAVLTGRAGTSLPDRVAACRMILDHGARAVLLKLGSEGALWGTRDDYRAFPACAVKAVDSTGAGDSFTAAFTAACLAGYPAEQAIEYATKAGALAVTKFGALASIPTKRDILNFHP